ncbi:MAG: TRAP transporter substrate-binding protein DctP, partial [Spirochaetales bacterium]|nr:TRAP transporter substrate-binding protein DctP [Spirochaetales bacterium]
SFGNMEAAKFEYLGFRVTQMLPWDMYDFFDRGVVDATQMGFAPMISMSIYEVANYWMLDNTYTAGNFLTVNLDWWNSLSDIQRTVIQEAANEVMEYSAGIYEEAIAEQVQLLKDKGCTVVEMSHEDFTTWWNAVFMSKAKLSLSMAEQRNDTDAINSILKAAAEFTDYNQEF